ncbi:MAG: serine/threonine-protein kinase [Verrucomicrobia bacterium]|nr:serine/threonine-protein kinase [Verrucomicrobiota bacterium]
MKTHKCAECGAVLADDVLDGLCPQCLIAKGLDKPPVNSGETVMVPAPDVPLGTVRYFGDYELLEEIAHGGMGIVYKARQVSLNRIVAVKMILAGQLAGEADVKRFHLEAEAAANLQHPNIVAIHEVGEHGGQHYFSMDYVEGKNLAELVQDGPLPPAHAARYLKTVAEAVHFAHQRGTIHRDLKPHNVLIDGLDQPRITDFGLAKQVAKESTLTQTGAVMGSPSYMSPEQAAGRHDLVGPPSDVYSLGAILYQLLTGRAPFVGATPMATLRMVQEDEPMTPAKLNPKVSADLETICLKCLEKKPERRYASARALAEDLERFLNHEPILARRPSVARQAWSWVAHHPWALTSIVSIGLMLLMGLICGLWEKVRYLEWLRVHPGQIPGFRSERFFSHGFGVFMVAEFFLVQLLPLFFFIRDRVRGLLRPPSLWFYLGLGLAQAGFGLYLLSRVNAAGIWVESYWAEFNSVGMALAALSNFWFGFRLIWHAVAALRLAQLGVAGGESNPLALMRVSRRVRLALLLAIQALCVLVASWYTSGGLVENAAFHLALVFGLNLTVAALAAIWMSKGEERLLYLPSLLLSVTLCLVGLNGPHNLISWVTHAPLWSKHLAIEEVFGFFKPQENVEPLLACAVIGLAGSVLMLVFCRLERALGPRLPLWAEMKSMVTFGWRHRWRFVWGTAALVVMLIGLVQIISWQGRRAWGQMKRDLAARGVKLDWAAYVPKPVPDEQNLVKHPTVGAWFCRQPDGGKEVDSALPRPATPTKAVSVAAPPTNTVSAAVAEWVMVDGGTESFGPNDQVFDWTALKRGQQRLALGRWFESPTGLVLVEKLPDPDNLPRWFVTNARLVTAKDVQALLNQQGLGSLQASPRAGPQTNVIRLAASQVCTATEYLASTDRLEPGVRSLRQALQRPHTYLAGDYSSFDSVPYFNFVAVRSVAQMFASRAQACLLLGRPDQALEELSQIQHLRRHLDETLPTLVNQMINVAMAGLYVSIVEAGFREGLWNDAAAPRLQEEMHKVNLPAKIADGMAFEQTAICQLMEQFANPPASSKRDSTLRSLGIYLPRGWVLYNACFYARLQQPLAEVVAVNPVRMYPAERIRPFNSLARICIPNWQKALSHTAYQQTQFHQAILACALHRYRLAHGSYPETLAALVPQYLAQLPHEVVNGEPMKYRPTGKDSYLLYWVWQGSPP